MRLKDKVALITGGGAGIGRGGVDAFLREGARLMIAERNPDFIARLRTELQGQENWDIVETDVTDATSAENAVKATVERFGRLDILYNNAGASLPKDGNVVAGEIDAFWGTLKLNLFGTWLMCHYAIPEIIKAGGGVVINTSSTAALGTITGIDSYSVSKAGVSALTRTMAKTFAAQNIRVNAVAPTKTMTERARSLDALREQQRGGAPAPVSKNLLGDPFPKDIANAVVFLASDEAAFITGHTLPVDSGFLL